MTSTRRGRTATRWIACLALLALLAAACSSGGDDEQADEPTTTTEAPATTTEAPATDDEPEPEPEPEVVLELPELDATPLPIDDDVTIGTLDNGLTYYLRSNDSPGSSLTVRLAVDAGSLQQDDPDAGTAHFLEHMLFNGTERYPGNELDRVLQTFGAGIGPDINAYTSYDETVYELTVTTTDNGDAVTTAFTVLAEWASNATIDPEEVVAERGVVRDEYRQRRENPDGRVNSELFEVYLAGTPYAGRSPIGEPDEIDATEAPALRAFYDTWYHPENMAVIAVGDLPVDEMLAEIEAAFAEVEGRGPAPDRPERIAQMPDPDGFASVITDPELVPDSLSVDWLRLPSDPATVGGARADVLDDLIAAMLGSRLNDAYLAGELPLDRRPFISTFGFTRSLSYFGTNLGAQDLGAAYAGLLGYLAGAADGGFTQDELDQAIDEAAAGLDAWEDRLGSTQDIDWTNQYVNHFLTGVGAEAPEDSIARERAILDDVTVAEVSERWALIHALSGPIAVPLGADPADMPTVDDLLAIREAVVPLEPVPPIEPVEQLMSAPAPVAPVESDGGEAGFGPWSFRVYDNGAVMVFETSTIEAGTVSMISETWGGSSSLPLDDFDYAELALAIVSGSGVGDVSTGQLIDFLGQRSASASPWVDDYKQGFEGSATTEDLELVFQLIHLGITEPTVDDTVFQSAIVSSEQRLDRIDNDPSLEAALELRRLVVGDEYVGVPSQTALDALDADKVLEVYRALLDGVDGMVFSIVGDVDVEVVNELADRYIGTLPPGDFQPPSLLSLPPVDSIERTDIELSEASGDGGVALRWEFEQEIETDQEAVTVEVLERIINSLIFETIREELGASYGGGASLEYTEVPYPSFVALITIDGDPDRLDEIVDAVRSQLARLSTDGPTGDELNRAVTVLADEFAFFANIDLIVENLMPALSDAQFVSLYTRDFHLAQVGSSDVRDLAADLFDLDAYIEVRRS